MAYHHGIHTHKQRTLVSGERTALVSAVDAFSARTDVTPPLCRRPEEAVTTAVGINRARQAMGKVNFMLTYLLD